MLDSFNIGGGARAVLEFDNGAGADLVSAPGHVVFEAFDSFQIAEDVSAQLYVFNVFDNTYVERVNDRARRAYFGQPLCAQLTIGAKF